MRRPRPSRAEGERRGDEGERSRAAVAHVNELARGERVGGLFHSTC